MKDIILILISVSLTSLMSLIAFLLSQMYYKPIERYKELKALTSYTLMLYANIYSNPIDIATTNNKLPDNYKIASEETRKLASDWKAFIYLKTFPGFFVLRNKKILVISHSLIGLSNSLTLPYNSNGREYRHESNNTKKLVDDINKILHIKS